MLPTSRIWSVALRLHPPQRLKRLWCNSQTKALSYTQLAGSGILASVSELNKAVTDPSIKEYLDRLDLPVSIIIALAVLGIVTYLAHGHTDA